MRSTMQEGQLGLARMARHMARVNGRSTIVTQYPSGRSRVTFRQLAERASRLATALARRGFKAGDRIATLMPATQEHVEAYVGVPYLGAVLHTVNIRLHDRDIAQICNDAGDCAFIVDGSMRHRFTSFAPLLKKLRLVALVGDGPADAVETLGIATVEYESLLQEGEVDLDRPEVEEHEAAILCHTGGTTGLPKGVAYSHRSLWLQANSLCTANSLGISASDRILPAIPLYHVNGWGLPFAGIMAGADIILPGVSLQAPIIAELIRDEKPTIAAGVPTIWTEVLALALERERTDIFASLRMIATGGALVAPSLIESYAAFSVRMVQAWGMTETCSMSAVLTVPNWAQAEERRSLEAKNGRIACGLELRVVGEDGKVLPSDGRAVGEIQIRGPWVTGSYFPKNDPERFQDGWLKTGDLGTVDDDGFLALTDRLKDGIKSGGEWISSLALEAAIQSHESIREVAVIAIPDARWQERPLAVVVLEDRFSELDVAAISKFVSEFVPRWWIPNHWVKAETIPRTGVGKFDKKLLRERFASGSLGHVQTI
jgi:fatty-acyl-CoA synthase